MLKCLLILIPLALAGCDSAPTLKSPDAAFTPDTVDIRGRVVLPYQPYDTTLPVVRGTVGGMPVQFVLDTGAETTLITPECAQRLGLKLRDENKQMVDAHNAIRRINGIAHVEGLALDSARFGPFDALCMPLPLRPANGQPLDGLLSRRVFSDLLLTIDYRRHVIELAKGELDEPDGKTILQAAVSANDAIRVPVKVGDKSFWFMIDSGFASRVSIDRNFTRDSSTDLLPNLEHRSQGVNSELVMQIRRINSPFRVGQYSWSSLEALNYAGSQNMIGSGLLQEYRVTFDQKHRRVQLLK